MKLSELLKKVNVLSDYKDTEITAVTDNSNKITEGCAFVCIKGNKFDAHNVAAEALQKGAAAVIVERDLGLDRQVICDNTRKAYSLMCSAFFSNPSEDLKLIGITGTNGKSTTAILIKSIMDKLGIKAGLIGTVKNMIGDTELEAVLTTPEPFELQSLFRRMADENCEYCVMEVSSQALAQERVEGCHFRAAVFTNLTQDHLDYHGSFEAYADAKQKLFRMCDISVLNMDDSYYKHMAEGSNSKVVTYSIEDDAADFTAKNIQYRQTAVSYELVTKGDIGRAHVGIPGKFSVYNSMAAAVTLVELGFGMKEVLEALEKAEGVKGRVEIVPTNTDFTVIIDYAHTPDGLVNVITALRQIAAGRIITLFGCGGDRDKTKRPIMGDVASQLSDVVVVTSDNPRTEDPQKIIDDILEGIKNTKAKVFVEPDRRKATAIALKEAKAGDIVLLAGKGQETYQILKDKTIHYDEREVVKELLEEMK
ncbi:MAG: UDP-N-acetylmuramoyl-L-alanyl-D-glutamate--2,6-diaminopimelate ligase [Clostridiales bacterium]|nr:UDP-N-acetylmuramoyl-L-alanyl-D-glutamate--2,6-diaminopimelate ligase [Clostridiales bacterium]HPP67711.1 UDP-N-acetylmuramoyl-L-alanyl-D-glutamate--2,6-diaminopimelate ligase [Clostridiales bacterium]HQA04803.1 UDP-N-acetylmuramoyl-L-alanyl-D-glutamate--2,6-diaminopimelate ligase [Clostridiales bacterium]HQD73053.1 UDP-N-acetylmuramoyl-L-alanyl-D-glutamate--2,6-diaminopimelate ligase [Clostridiales bacterium]